MKTIAIIQKTFEDVGEMTFLQFAALCSRLAHTLGYRRYRATGRL